MSRKTTPFGISTDLWQRHRERYMKIFCRALNLLEIDDEQRKDEDIISEKLFPILRHICRIDGKGAALPNWELPIHHNHKRPDFTCALINVNADSDDMYEIPLHIECKRLGEKPSSTWNLNKNYVENGIKRYDDNEYDYGKNAPSGIMIGYIVSSRKMNILNEVNNYLPKEIGPLKFVSPEKLEIYESKYQRKLTTPFDFTLHHIWVDLRSKIE
jgi:hypothetical protein